MRKRTILCIAVALVLAASIIPAQAGRIVVTNDEWTLSNTGYSQSGTQPGQFALNVANWFSGGTGSFLVYSSDFGLTQSSLQSTMTGAGYGWTINTAITPTLANLQAFNAVFLCGNVLDNNTLINYVNGGGNVFLEGGTGANDAATWNTFLNAFGLGYYSGGNNGIQGNIAISSAHPIFNNVSALYQNNGTDLLDTNLSDTRGQVLVTYNGHGLYAVYDPGSSGPTTVPEPTTVLLLAFGLVGLAGARGFRK